MSLVDKQDHGLGRGVDFVDHPLEAALEFALDTSPRLQQPHIKGQHAHILEGWRYLRCDHLQGEAFDNRRFPDPGFSDQDRVVLASTHEDVDQLPDFTLPADDRVDQAFTGLARQVLGKTLQP